MYRVYFINHGYYAQQEFHSVEHALEYAAQRGFEVAVQDEHGNVVAAWGVISGRRYYGN